MGYSLRNLNVLLVEDDPSMRALVRDVLSAFEVGRVRSVSEGGRAYQLLRGYAADIIILDWLMQPVNGMEFLQRVRNAGDTPNPFVPIIMLTAFTALPRVEECRDAGMTEFLAKPFTPTTLYNRIESVIEDQRLFVRSSSYFGPDRRRVERPFIGPDRRADSNIIDIDLPD